ncbi:hypothetical protein DYB36_002523 [Aphanomyces astaci]|uniref:Conserved oligomeric Golgi complex subunit 4 C-terminal domain-containing protein n=1 Tax=Aphanomyces astaci TaxID=112090 RepID=A0A397B119_APHAT|nr:hypothetical protein DYB36_002523 [Aphanomyces astaci]
MEAFNDHIGSFYEALAEDKLDQLADALLSLRDAAATLPMEDPATVMLNDCENKASAKGQLALSKLHALVSTLNASLGRKSNDDTVLQYERLDSQLRTVINTFYTSYALSPSPANASSLAVLVEYVDAEFKQRASLRVDSLGKLKAAAPVNGHGYIDRSVHLEALNGLVHDVSFVVSLVEEANVSDLAIVFAPIHAAFVRGVLDILALYAADARLAAWEKKVSLRSTSPSNDLDDVQADESLQMVDLLLEELACILQLCLHYSAYAASFLVDQRGGNGDGGLSQKVHELNGVYLLLERFYIFQTMHKAVMIAEPQQIEPNVYAISKNYHTVLSVVIAIVESLERTYMPSILDLPRRSFDMPLPVTSPTHHANDSSAELSTDDLSFSDALLQAVDADLTHQLQVDAKMMMAVVSAYMSWEYVGKIHVRITETQASHFAALPSLLECLPKPLSELQLEFHQVFTSGLHALYARDLQPKMDMRFHQSVLQWQYELSLQAYDYLEVHGSPLVALVQSLLKDKTLRRFRRGLSPPTFELMWRQVVRDMCDWIERGVTQKTFNDVGAMQLEKEVRHLSVLCGHFPAAGDVSLRAEFTRLDQVNICLGTTSSGVAAGVVALAGGFRRDLAGAFFNGVVVSAIAGVEEEGTDEEPDARDATTSSFTAIGT